MSGRCSGVEVGGSEGDAEADAPDHDRRVPIEIDVREIPNDKGQLVVLLFDDPAGFPTDLDRAIARIEAPLNADDLVFNDVSPGTYAVLVVHDYDEDGALKTNLFGKPVEGIGVSNNAIGGGRRPSFDDAKFVLSGESAVRKSIIVNFQ